MCFQYQNLFISILRKEFDISIFGWSKTAKKANKILEPSSIIPRWFLTQNLIGMYKIGPKLWENNATVNLSSIQDEKKRNFLPKKYQNLGKILLIWLLHAITRHFITFFALYSKLACI